MVLAKRIATLVIMLGMLAAVAVYADGPAATNTKVPAEVAVKIRNVQLDQARMQTQILQLQSQYQADQSALQRDDSELTTLKLEAFAAAKLTLEEFSLAFDKLEFVARPKAEKK